jgi:predicted RNase H-like nuclease
MIAGVDGCKKGWLVAMSEGWPCAEPPWLEVCVDFAAVLDVTSECAAVVVDMPIGLPVSSEGRLCDSLARKMLTGKGGTNRVFPTPPRGSLAARTASEFQRRHKDLTGRGASLPVWGIVPKLKEVDELMTPALQERVLEYHPELVWTRLAGEVLASKHKADGLLQRMTVLLRSGATGAFVLGNDPASARVQLDDVLDAVVGLAVAADAASGCEPKCRIPDGEPPVDECGLRMVMWY